MHVDLSTESVDAENWELEKWRKENPMDYLKSLCILNMSDNSIVKEEVFNAIYKVTRLHIPNVLYKYYSLSSDEILNEKKFQTMREGKIYMADIKSFNDPFDGKAFFYKTAPLAEMKQLEACGGRLIDDFSAYIKATSLTANGIQSMPMWAHYSSNHTGFCVSYDMIENTQLKECTFPVQYTSERLDVTSLMLEQAQQICGKMEHQIGSGEKEILLDDLVLIFMLLLLCNLKHISWNYEKEFRCTTSANATGMPFIEAKPKEIYIGMNCTSSHTKHLLEIADFWQIPVYKMSFDECSEVYNLVAKRCGRQ